ncbi:efflux RND transporter periplasmic adaptor subunit [Aliidiomarina celeris]|uniref:efflux RND transporter periplasmic adaptor subunit n=1 Tax=Aliidiomarina celeris TaxID=2249428 RepID=UPI000DE9946D|nr:efflux RND transporter periplasmic adaptor subunit [Aliidiomarina celeris]
MFNQKWLTTGVIAGMLVLALNGCSQAGAEHSSKEAEPEEKGVPVEVLNVSTGQVRATYLANAVLEAEDSTDVIARVNGVLEAIHVEEGDYVEKGQPLAKLESARYALAVDQIEAELRHVRQELTRHRQLAERQMVSADNIERLQSQLDSLQARLELAQIDLEETIIRAPIAGHIAQRHARTGRLVQAWQPESLFHIVNNGTLRATVNLPEHALSHIQPGLAAQISLQALPQAGFVSAQVTRVSPVIDSGSGTFRVMIEVPNNDFNLRSGMFARVQIHYAERNNVVRIPQDALIQADNQSHVFTVNDGIAQKIEVITGLSDNGWVEINEGLTVGAKLIVTGHTMLRDAAKVEVIEL